MPPLVTHTPASLDTSLANKNAFPNSSQAGFGSGIPAGPWFITGALGGDAWYAVSCDNRGGRSPSGQDTPQVYKSTDNRLTWTKVAEMGNQYNLWNLFYPGSGTTLYLLVTDHGDAGLPPRLVTFNFAADSFGTPSSAHSTITFQGQTTGVQIVLIAVTVFLIFDHAADTSIRYTSITAGVWAGSTTLRAGAAGNQVPTGGVQEAGGRYTFFWPDQPANKNNWWRCQISSLGVMGTPTLAYSLDTTGSDQIVNGTQLSQVVGNFIIFPFTQLDNSGDGNQKAAALIGTPLSAPVFTFAWVDPTGAALPAPISFGNPYVERDCLAVLDKNGHLLVFFTVYLPSGSGTGVKQQIWYAQFDGVSAFGAVVEFFDSGTTPFPNQTDGSGASMFGLSGTPTQKADGSWTFMVGTDFDSPAVFNLLNYVIYTSAGPTVVCPPATSGTVGVLFSSGIGVTSGTPPYTYSATGLPPGLTLNTFTGVISGTPLTPGTYNVVITVTDANGLTATVSCPIVIGECVVTPFQIHQLRFRMRPVGEYIDGTIGEYYESPEFNVQPGRVGELKDFLLDYDVSGAGGRLELYTDKPTNALALRRTLAIPAQSTRGIYVFPLESAADVTSDSLPAGQLFKVRLYPPPGGILRLHGRAVFRARIIGVYFVGGNSEVWETQPVDLFGGMALYRQITVVAQTAGPMLFEMFSELPGQDMRVVASFTLNPSSSTAGRLPVYARLPGATKGRLQKFRISGAYETRIFEVKILGRRLEVNGSAWDWASAPLEATPDEWAQIQMPVRDTPEAFDWIDVPVDPVG